MAHGQHKLDEADKEPIGAKLWPTFRLLGAAAIVGLILLIVGVLLGEHSMRRFFFAYLIGYTFVLGLTVGSVALVILTHLFRAGWVVAVRRVPETFAANFWIVGLLSIPLLFGVFDTNAPLYPWSASIEVAEKNLHDAEQFLHDLNHPAHGGHDDGHEGDGKAHDGEDHAVADTPDVLYVAADAGKEHDGEAHGDGPLDGPSDEYLAAVNAMVAAGDAYPEDKAQARFVQNAYYQSLLGYMLDYKRFGGQLAGDAQVPEGKGFTWFNPMLFALRLVLYFAVLSVMGWYYWTRSVKQDETGDIELTTKREWWGRPPRRWRSH